ncbi:MAG: heavy-metal-associated domain-containing protein [Candidatus Marinimicrobia bacterium]|nr:heavy-metal-associated domain-containing protein [Candidatus Neomarinimicrobiota bacterium]
MKKAPVFLLIALGLVILIAGSYAPEGFETTEMKITGMHCNNCVEKIETVLSNLKGIQNAKVNFDKSVAEIVYDPLVVNMETISTTITDLGFNGGIHKECDHAKGLGKYECSFSLSGKSGCSGNIKKTGSI